MYQIPAPRGFGRPSHGSAYANPVLRSDRENEYALLARVTAALVAARAADGLDAPARRTQALAENAQLWSALGSDCLDDRNRLPAELRGQIVSLALFVQRHSCRALAGSTAIDPLIDINRAILQGLRARSAGSA